MKLYSYIVVSDSGFAPNPFHGFCTLTCCKPRIRKAASVDDWIIGLTPKRRGHKLVYAMKVNSTLSTAEYWHDARFARKRPNFRSERDSLGDNIYEPKANGMFQQHRSRHSAVDPNIPRNSYTRYIAKENTKAKDHDLTVKRVLVASEFVYFGTNEAIELPSILREALAVGIGHKSNFQPDIISLCQAFIAKQPRGIQGLKSLIPKSKRQCRPSPTATAKS